MIYNIYDFLEKTTSRCPQKIAVISGDAELTYQEIREKSLELAYILKKYKIKKNDRIGICLDKSPEEIIAIFSIAKADAIFVCLNIKLKSDQIVHIINNCGIKAIITNKKMFGLLLKKIICNTSVKFLFFLDDKIYRAKKIETPENISGNSHKLKDIACIIYTSGSTGKSKGVIIPNKNLIEGADIVSQYLHCRHDDKVLSLLPFSFDYGLNQLMTTFRNGATIVLHNFVFPEDVLRTIGKKQITAVAGIPTIWISIINSPSIKRHDLSSLRYITNSGGKIPVEYVYRMLDIFKSTRIYLMYGLTEAFRSTYLPPYLVSKKPDSIGKAIPRVKISVLNKDGIECKSEEPGDLVHRGALISMGYWNDKKASNDIIRKLPDGVKDRKRGEKGVFSGDLVKKDKDGFLYFLGRKDEMIKSSGYRISPTEIEEVLYQIDGVTGSVVFGRENSKLGQQIVAVLSCKYAINKDSIIDYSMKHLPDYAVPHEVIFLDNMPQTSSGKIDRSLVKEKYGN